jgi:hypothetical protein
MIKSIFIASSWEHFQNDLERENFIATHITDKENIELFEDGTELVFENNKLTKAYGYEDGEQYDIYLLPFDICLDYKDYQENHVLQIVEDKGGMHQIGGDIPFDFKLPKVKSIVQFQYLGYIDNQQKEFNWLPFKIHLTSPIFLNIRCVFLDYSNPYEPVVINKDEVEKADTSYDEDLNQDSEIIYNEMKFNFIKGRTFSEIGHAGIPEWIQSPNIPICPKSGKMMKFLCQFDGGVSAKTSNVVPHNEFYRHYYEELNFWGSGYLYIFFEPTSKTACYIIQCT